MRKAIICLIFLFVFAAPVKAARSLSISSDKTSLFGDEEMLLTAYPAGFASTEAIFVKGAFYQEGSTNYFGYTKNGDNWIKNGDSSTNQLQVNISDWDGGVRIKCDFGDSGYKGEGDYKLKLGFYYTTANGTLSSVNWSSNILSVSISEPDPTPTETPQPTKTPTPTPIKTCTPTPTPAKTTTPSPSPKATKSPTPTPSLREVSGTESGKVLGIESNFDPPTPSVSPSPNKIDKSKVFSFVLIGLGFGFISLSIYLGFAHKYNDKNGFKS